MRRFLNKGIALLLIICTMGVLLAGCSGKDTPAGKLIYYYLETEPKNLDPQVSKDYASRIVIQNLFEGLARLDESGTPVPGVAERWEASADQRQYTFYLRETAKWSDESELTAQDFLFGIQRALDPATGSDICEVLFCIENAEAIRKGEAEMSSLGVQVVGTREIRFTLNESMPEFPALTAEPVFLPCKEEFFTECAGRYGLEPDTVLGNGPFMLRKRYGWVHQEYLHLVKNGTYHAPEEILPAGVKLKIARFPEDAVADLLNVDVFLDASPLRLEQLEEARVKGLTVTAFEDTTWGLRINSAAMPFTSLSMRQAVMQSLSFDVAMETVLDNTEPIRGILPEGMTLGNRPYRERVGQVRRLYSSPEVTHDLMRQGLKELGRSSMPEITILCADSLDAKKVANNLLTQWKKGVGEYFRIVTLSQEEIQKRVTAGNYQLAIVKLENNGTDPAEYLSQLLPAETEWELSRREDERITQIYQMENDLIAQGIFYPLFGEKHYFAMAPNVSGIRFSPFQGGIDFRQAGKLDDD